MGSYTKAVYTAEQMARLGVDEDGYTASAVQTLGAPARPRRRLISFRRSVCFGDGDGFICTIHREPA